jgi:hypothetical protein
MTFAPFLGDLSTRTRQARRLLGLALALSAAALLAGCGAGGVSNSVNPATGTAAPSAYNGPVAQNQDVQAFMVNLWMNVHATNRCGSCHIQGVQSPSFARGDDINLAYQAANTVVNLSNPSQSIMVLKVGGGHHCWLADNTACADQLTTWISNWAGVTGGTTAAKVQLVAPADMAAGGSKNFPADPSLFQANVWPLLTKYCSRCHQPNALTPQSPYFASPDINVAYPAAQPKMNLNNPAASRFVVRLGTEFHNCWSVCAQNAATMQAAIQSMANGIPVTQVNSNWVLSRATTMLDGTIASSGGRYEASLIAKYEFKTGTGTVAYDTSGVEPGLDLNFFGNVTWDPAWGVQFSSGGRLQGTSFASSKLATLIQSTGEYTVEAWVAPSDAADKMAYFVSYSGGPSARNFTVAQDVGNYAFLNENGVTSANGMPALETPTMAMILQPTLQHVVATYDPINGRQLFVNGMLVAGSDPQKGGNLGAWDQTFALVLGNEVSGTQPFTGELRLVAIYNRALSLPQIQMNYNAGVGQRFYVLFNISTLINQPNSYVMFVVSEYDAYSYLFEKPTFINLDPKATPTTFELAGMRIGVNGQQANVGQAYIPLDVMVGASGYTAAGGFPLTRVGTTIPLQNGPANDVFFLTFAKLGTLTNVQTDPVPAIPTPVFSAPPSDIGVKSFDRINATMAAVTGVPVQTAKVSSLFQNLELSLPASQDFQSFVASHQVAIAQLSMQYCNSLVSDPTLATAYFPGFNLSAAPSAAFTPANTQTLVNQLINNVLGTKVLATDPNRVQTATELTNLINSLATSCGSSCPANRTATVVSAACAALTGSAATLVE